MSTVSPVSPEPAERPASVVVPVDAPDDPDSPTWSRPPATSDQQRSDLLGAVALFIGAVLSMVLWRTTGLYDEPASGLVSVAWLAAATLPLGWRRRFPSVVLVIVAVVFIVAVTVMVPETLFLNIALFTALYTVGAWEASRRRAAWVRAVVVLAMFVWLLINLFRASTDPELLDDLDHAAGAFSPMVAYTLIQVLTNILYFAGAYWFGNHAWTSARERARTRWRTRQLQAERVRVEAQAVTIERLRLARELHDAVAHHVSVMGVQAAAARTLIDADPSGAARALEHVEDSARDAIEELHGLIGTLRDHDHDHDGDRDPAVGPDEAVGSLGVRRIPDLVRGAEQAGLPTSYRVVGDEVPLPPLVSLNLYRIAQEALTNVRKHAGRDAGADVRLRYLPDAVELEVTNDGSVARRTGGGSGGGLGILGMRERVAADGGTLETGPRRSGGFVVRAQVPLRREEPS